MPSMGRYCRRGRRHRPQVLVWLGRRRLQYMETPVFQAWNTWPTNMINSSYWFIFCPVQKWTWRHCASEHWIVSTRIVLFDVLRRSPSDCYSMSIKYWIIIRRLRFYSRPLAKHGGIHWRTDHLLSLLGYLKGSKYSVMSAYVLPRLHQQRDEKKSNSLSTLQDRVNSEGYEKRLQN